MNNNKTDKSEEVLDLSLPRNKQELMILNQYINPINGDIFNFIDNNFEVDFLKDSNYKTIYQYAKSYHKKYSTPPPRTFFNQIFERDEFVDKKNALIKEINNIYDFNSEQYGFKFIKDNIETVTRYRAMYQAILDNLDVIEQYGDITVIMNRFEKIMKINMDNDLGIDYFKQIKQIVESIKKPNKRIPSLYKSLDKYTNGGIYNQDTFLGLIMAQPGLGKSQGLMNLTHQYLLQNKKVLIITLELTQQMYCERMSGIIGNLNVNQLILHTDSLLKKANAFSINNPQAQLVIKEYPTGSLSANQLKAFIKQLHNTTGFYPDILMIDYAGIMRPNDRRITAKDEVGTAISVELREISGSFDPKIPIWTCIQSNRDGYNTEDIDINNSAGSSGWPATADFMAAFYRLDGDKELCKKNLKIIKNRLGGYEGSVIPFYSDNETLRLTEFEENQNQNDSSNILDNLIDDDENDLANI